MWASSAFTADPAVVFDLPGGRLAFGEGQLDPWAEHLAWCYRLLGVEDGETIAVQDFGSSPLSFLGSALLTPGLGAGAVELLGGRMVCLDASYERVLLTPAVFEQLRPDVLVVRADLVGLLLEQLRKAGAEVEACPPPRVLVAADGRWPELPGSHWRRLLCVERALLLAPESPACCSFHIREGLYALDGSEVRNLGLPSLRPHPLRLASRPRRGCELGEGDWLVRLSGEGEA
jgi:hypothetical protein